MKKRIIAIFMSIFMVCSLLNVVSLASDNPVVNNSFELPAKGTEIPNWGLYGGSKGLAENVEVKVISDKASEGSKSLSISEMNSNAAIVVYSDPIAIKAGEVFNLTAKVANTTGGVNFAFRMYDSAKKEPMDKNFVASPNMKMPVIGDDFTDISVEVVVPEKAVVGRVFIYTSSASTGKCIIDNIKLAKGEPTEITSVLPMKKSTEKVDYELKDIGSQIHSVNIHRTTFGYDNSGNFLAYSGVVGNPAQLTVTDVVTEKVIKQIPVTNGTENVTYLRGLVTYDNVVYMCGTPAKLYKYVPGSDKVEFLTNVPGSQNFDMKVTPDGVLIGGSYNKADGWEYDIKTGKLKSYGTIMEGQNYAYSVAYDEKRDDIYYGIATIGQLVKLNRKTGEKENIPLHPKVETTKFLFDMDIAGDRLFIRYSPGDTVVYNLETKSYECDPFALRSRFVSKKAPNQNRVYYTYSNTVGYYDIDAKKAVDTKAYVDGYASGMDYTDKLDQEGFKGNVTLVGVTREGRIFKYNTETGYTKYSTIPIAGEATELQTVDMETNGNIHVTGYLNGGSSTIDPFTMEREEFTVEAKGLGQKLPQCDQAVSYGKYIFYTTYPSMKIWKFDTTKPWDVKKGNPTGVYSAYEFNEQDRGMAALVIEDMGILAVGSVPKYGINGGALTLYDIENDKGETYANIIKGQSITSLAYKDGILYGGSCIYGGLGIQPTEKEAKLFAYDVKNRKMLYEVVPIPGYKTITQLMFTPDGKLWGAAEGALFEFDVTKKEVTYKATANKMVYGSHLWRDCEMFMGNDGYMYLTHGKSFYRVNLATKEQSVILDNSERYWVAQDIYGNFYLTNKTTLLKLVVKGNNVEPTGAELVAGASYAGEKVNLTINGIVSNGNKLGLQETKKPVYTSSDSNVISIKDGVPYGINEGTATLSATIKLNGKSFTTAPVEIKVEPSQLKEKALQSSVIMGVGNSNSIVKGDKKAIDSVNDVKPIVIDGRTVIPARFIAESFGAKVDWEESTKTVTITYKDVVTTLILGETKMKVGETEIFLDVPATEINGRTLLPLRAIAENALGKRVSWKDMGSDEGLIVISDDIELIPDINGALMDDLYGMLK